MSDCTSFSIKIERIIATIMIFLCHTVFLFGEFIAISSQFFNIGVDVFLIISAYLFSSNKTSDYKVLNWYKKRFFRITTPYYLLLLFLLLYYFFFGVNFNVSDYFGYYVFSQGLTENYLPGLSHLWYITAIVLAYIITPFLYKIRKTNTANICAFLIFLTAIFVVLTIFVKPILETIYFCILEYTLFFMIFSKNKKNIEIIKEFKLDKVFVTVVLVILFCILKIVSNILLDGTNFYMYLLVPIIDMLIGASIFAFIFSASKCLYPWFTKNNNMLKVINHLDSISFEFYLVHYLVITGPVNLVLQLNSALNFILILFASYILSLLLHVLSEIMLKMIKTKIKL